MKVAILLAGQVRKYDDPSLLYSMNKFIKQFGNPDIFISTWSKRGYSQAHGDGTPFSSSCNPVTKEELMLTYPNVKDVQIDDEEEWINTISPYEKEIYEKGFDWNGQHFRGTVVPQYYTIKVANSLKQNYELQNNFKYDLVIRTRFDNLHLSFLDPLDLVDLSKVYTLNHPPHYYPERIYDVFFYTNSQNMDLFCEGYEKLKELEDNSFNNGLNPRDSNRIFYVQFKNCAIDVIDLPYNVCETYR